MHAEDLTCAGLNVTTGLTFVHEGQGAVGLIPENDGNVVEFYCGFSHYLRSIRSMRSRMMATTTITNPDSKPRSVRT